MELLANWLWQGSAVALAASAVLQSSRRMSATVRYRLWWVTLLLVLLLPVLPVLLPVRSPAVAYPAVPDATAITVQLPQLPWWPVVVLTAFWIGWALLALTAASAAFFKLQRTKRTCTAFPAHREERLRAWTKLHSIGRRTRLMVSRDVTSASVLGMTSPLIAVSPRVLDALDDRELDQVLVHEWAHVQRRDDVARFVQVLVVAIAGLHPAVWWINRQLQIEREAACDDWAVRLTGSPRQFAACLTKLASLHVRPAEPSLAPTAAASGLSTRVVRLLDQGRSRSINNGHVAGAVLIPLLSTIALGVSSVELVVGSSLSASPFDRATREAVEPVSRTASQGPAREPATSREPVNDGRRHDDLEPSSARQAPASQAPDKAANGRVPERQPASDISARDRSASPPASNSAPIDVAIAHEHLTELPGTPTAAPGPPTMMTAPPPSTAAGPSTPWGVAADAGVNVGKGSQKAAVKTAGFFTRMGKSIAGAF
jgi:beta-lactamase regulating signal transducer with metallopeptidase domain